MEAGGIKWFDEVDSTNSRMAADKSFLDDFTTYAAKAQSAGRGQKGNGWHSAKGENLTFSTLLKPEWLPVPEQFAISQAAALAVVDYLADKSVPAKIKWPNDIYVGERKICGILIENSLAGEHLSTSIAGIGLNLNQTMFPTTLPNPVSLKTVTGRNYNPEEELVAFLAFLRERYESTRSSRSRNSLDIEYMESLFQRGEWHNFERMEESDVPVEKRNGHVFRARILGINSDGRLLLENKEGIVNSFAFKEIKYLI